MPVDTVLIVGGGALQVPMIEEAKQMGLRVIITDQNPECPGKALADRFYGLDTYAEEAHVALIHTLKTARLNNIRGVLTCGADVAPTVAAAANAAKTPGIDRGVAHQTHNKSRVREELHYNKMDRYQPRWINTDAFIDDLFDFMIADPGLPVVVKPVDQCASRGISIVEEYEDFFPAILKAGYGRGVEILIEERLYGTEHSAEMLLLNREPIWFNIVERPFVYDRGVPLSLGHVNPSSVTLDQWEDAKQMMVDVAKQLGVHWGAFKGDLILTGDGWKILEVTARLSGGFDCQRTSPLTGRHPMRALLQMSCGMTVDAPLGDASCYAACIAALPKPGRFKGLITDDPPEGAVDTILNVALGDIIRPYDDCAARPGFVLSTGETYDEALLKGKAAADRFADMFITEEI